MPDRSIRFNYCTIAYISAFFVSALADLCQIEPQMSKKVTFEQFLIAARSNPSLIPNLDDTGTINFSMGEALPDEGPDPKVMEFLDVLENYRLKCEKEGNYEETARALDQLSSLRKQEEDRRIKAMRAHHSRERDEVELHHNQQETDFRLTWDRYLAEYDAMASMYITHMQEKHMANLRAFQESLHEELLRKPPKFGKEVLEWRTKENLLVKQRKYADAAKVRVVADELERRERARLDEERLQTFAQREAKFRAQQRQELEALLKRIESRRSEHCKQMENDMKRLGQRNKNIRGVLMNKQIQEEQKFLLEIRKVLAPPRVTNWKPQTSLRKVHEAKQQQSASTIRSRTSSASTTATPTLARSSVLRSTGEHALRR